MRTAHSQCEPEGELLIVCITAFADIFTGLNSSAGLKSPEKRKGHQSRRMWRSPVPKPGWNPSKRRRGNTTGLLKRALKLPITSGQTRLLPVTPRLRAYRRRIISGRSGKNITIQRELPPRAGNASRATSGNRHRVMLQFLLPFGPQPKNEENPFLNHHHISTRENSSSVP